MNWSAHRPIKKRKRQPQRIEAANSNQYIAKEILDSLTEFLDGYFSSTGFRSRL
jgi:hypothetical protein